MSAPQSGKVYLIGAGPGAADLLTLRALRALREAEILLVDDLLPEDFFDDAGLSLAGKEVIRLPRRHDAEQGAINERLARLAAEGRTVARVKSGDPFVFGRGFEEADFLAARSTPCEVIPGISAGLAGPAGAGLALTRRGRARSFAFATAVESGGVQAASFPRADTLVLFMAVGAIENATTRLQAEGWPPQTPCALIERAGLPWERETRARLEGIASAARAVGASSPALLVVGRAAEDRIGEGHRPTILFTGLDPTNFRALGRILHWPALVVEPDPAGLARAPGVVAGLRAGRFQDVIFTSRVGVVSLMAAIEGACADARALAGARIIAAGGGTALRLRDYGLRADATGQPGGSEGILAAVGAMKGRRILLVQGTHAPRDLESRLLQEGAEVVRLALHRVVPNPALGRPLPGHDVVFFLSPSGVRAFSAAYGEGAFAREAWCIGQATRRTLDAAGVAGARIVEAPGQAAQEGG